MDSRSQNCALNVYNKTRLNDDDCEVDSKNRTNQLINDYLIFNPGQNNRSQYLNSACGVGVYQSGNMDGLGQAVDNGSSLLNGKMGNIMTSKSKRTGKCLKTRLFPGSPYMGAGQSTLKNTDIKSKLMSGQNTHSNKAGGSLAGVYVNRFTPLIPCLKDNVQNVSHIVPTHWVRGGESTRTVVRNIDYMKNCGMR